MNRRLERRLDLVPQKCAKSVCLSSISRITHVSDTGRPEGDDVLVAAVGGGSAGRRPSRRCGEALASDEFPAVEPAGDTLLRSRTGEQPPGSTLILTGRIGVQISGLVGARGGRIGLPDSLSGGVSRRAGRGDSHSEIRRTWFGARFEATTWMVGDLVTTEAPPLAGLAARRRLLARLRSAGALPTSWRPPPFTR
jgi:hypothetical protein